jgi:hypothetical protein
MEGRTERPIGVQSLVIKTDEETITKMTQAYESLRRVHEANEQQQRQAGQRIEDERRSRISSISCS